MRINIASSHRFWLLDLARELEKCGHEVRFYSYVPTKRAVKFGLKKESSCSLYYLMLPFLVLLKIFKSVVWTEKVVHATLDFYVFLFMKPCDIFIALGVVYTKSLVQAKKKYNAITIVEWGSKHLNEQQRILSLLPNYKKQSNYFTKKTLFQYEYCDYISIPSKHVKESFIERGVKETKLLINPYAVNLSMFNATNLQQKDCFDLIMVGGWSYRKGCDLIIEVCRKHNFSFLHVGGIVDVPFPRNQNMVHFDPVDESELIKYYSKARVFLLPSREDGFGMVLGQALVCGLPIVCSKHTGGRDLRDFLEDKQWIIEMKEYTVEDLGKCIDKALELAKTQNGLRSYSDAVVNHLSWEAYGKRYQNNLIKFCNV